MWFYLSGLITWAMHSLWPGTVTGRTERGKSEKCHPPVVELQPPHPEHKDRTWAVFLKVWGTPDPRDSQEPWIHPEWTREQSLCWAPWDARDWLSLTTTNPLLQVGIKRTVHPSVQQKGHSIPTIHILNLSWISVVAKCSLENFRAPPKTQCLA